MAPDAPQAPQHARAVEPDEDAQLDLAALRDYLALGVRHLRRRILVALGVAALVVAGVAILLRVLPKTYRVETTILIQGDPLASSLAAGRSEPAGTQGAGDLVLSRKNLLSIIQQTNLVERWKLTRLPLYRLKDALYARLIHPITDDQLVDALIFLLERRLVAWSDDRKVRIEVAWNDPGDAYRIATATQQNFLESCQLAETSAIMETIAILESHVATAREQVDGAIASARAARPREVVRSARPAEGASQSGERPAARLGASAQTLRLRAMLDGKERAVEDLEQLRRRRLAELQAQYTEQKAVYAESHPILVNLRESIQALAQDSPQLAQLRREVHELEAAFVASGGRPDTPAAEASSVDTPPAPLPPVILRDATRDPREEYARLELTNATSQYNALLDRLNSARLELDAARASFKYRYLIVRPPLPPRVPIRPNTALILAAGAVLGLVAGVVAALALELRKGIVMQEWQIERSLGIPLLAELPAAALAGGQAHPPQL
jgi:uncharacterized protein involved in exopolysaccharide biosynthesis